MEEDLQIAGLKNSFDSSFLIIKIHFKFKVNNLKNKPILVVNEFMSIKTAGLIRQR